MKTMHRWLVWSALTLFATGAAAQTVLDSPELYAGEKAMYDAAKKEGMVVSFDTGPTWANWAAQFVAFKKRYPEIEIVYNDIGSGATVVALDKARNRPQADTAYYFAASAIDAVNKGVVAFRIAASPPVIWVCAVRISEKGTTLLKSRSPRTAKTGGASPAPSP